MNFLSHFYFVREYDDPYLIMGTVLPDLTKNHRKEWILHPGKHAQALGGTPETAALYKGWMLHLEVDRLFHSSAFFREHTIALRKAIAEIAGRTPFRPFFLAHIAYELILDSLLVTENQVDVPRFYRMLIRCKRSPVNVFLQQNKIRETSGFFSFLESFIASRYLESYRKPSNMVYALNRVAQRVWDAELSEEETEALTRLFAAYKTGLQRQYLDVFKEINNQLVSLQ